LLNLPDAPECQNLATEGISHDPQALAAELEAQVQAEGDSDVGLILNAMLDLLGENPEATQAMVEGGHLDTAGRDEEEQEPAEKVDLVTDILAGTFGEEELKEAAERDEAEEGTTQQPYPEKSLPNYFIKGRGEPCKRGEAASRTGCIPKVKPTPKRRNTQTTEQPPLQREPLQPPTLEPRQDAAVEQEPTAADASTPTPDELVEKRAKTKRKTPEEKKQQIADMVERINGLRNRHNHTAEDVTDLAKTLCDELTVRQLTDLKKALGGLPASGRDKKAYAKRIAERIFGRSAEASPTSPSPAPSMRGTAAPPEEPMAEAPPPAPEAQAPEPRVETFPHEQQEPEPGAEQSQQPSPEIGTAPTGEPVVDQEAIEPSQEEPAPEPAAEQQAPEPAPDEAVAEVENALPPETTEEQARDQQWADELRSSDRNVRNQAWSDFIEAHKKGLMGFVAKKIKNPADVENIMQEAYVSMLVGMDRYDPAKSSLRNYLFTIAFRRATDAMRKKGRSKEESGAGGDFGGEEGDVFSRTADTRTQAPDEIAAETETNQRRTAAVRRAADTISQQLRAKGREQDAEIWELAWNGGMKPAEIAAKLNVRAQAVSNVTMKARDRMKELLKKYAPKEFTDDQQ
jgi:RNA polymerase sigma factor (sigma-70 family)